MSKEAFMQSVQALALELNYPESVMPPLLTAAAALPGDLPIESLTEPQTAEAAWDKIAARIPQWEEDDGMAQLAVTTAAAVLTKKKYQHMGISMEIFRDTMLCIPRFLGETKEICGRWAYDRGYWTWRQTAGLIVRLGTLEFGYHDLQDEKILPPGLKAVDPVIGVHIPTDVDMDPQALEASYAQARKFFFGDNSGPWKQSPPRAMICGSWLLDPNLQKMLPEASRIRRFASDFTPYGWQEFEFYYRWIFRIFAPGSLEDLPENTSLQRKVKAHLLSGGAIGNGLGYYRNFP